MKTKTILLKVSLTLLVGLFMSSCATHQYVIYPGSGGTGTIKIFPTEPTFHTYVTANNKLVLEKKNIKSLTIHNVPDGIHIIEYGSNSSTYKETLSEEIELVTNGDEVAVVVQVPPRSKGYMIYTGIALAGTIILLLAIW